MFEGQDTLGSLIGMSNPTRYTNISSLLNEIKRRSPMAYTFLKAIKDKFDDILLNGSMHMPAEDSSNPNTPIVSQAIMTPSRFFKEVYKEGVTDIRASRAQVIIKLLTEYFNKLETFNRFLVVA